MCWVECVLEFENTELYIKLITFGGTVIRKTKQKKKKHQKTQTQDKHHPYSSYKEINNYRVESHATF